MKLIQNLVATEDEDRGSGIARFVALALAYYLTGRIGLLLAIPPGYATAVWPASGIALSGILLFGYRFWPAVVLGSFLVNIGNSYDASSTSAFLNSAAIAISIGLGAGLQAIAGTFLVRRCVGFPNSLDREKDILKFLFLGGPTSCLINATWGTGSLLAVGLIQYSNAAFGWWTWWVGDTIGVLIFTLTRIDISCPASAGLAPPETFGSAATVFDVLAVCSHFRIHQRVRIPAYSTGIREAGGIVCACDPADLSDKDGRSSGYRGSFFRFG